MTLEASKGVLTIAMVLDVLDDGCFGDETWHVLSNVPGWYLPDSEEEDRRKRSKRRIRCLIMYRKVLSLFGGI